VPPPPRSRAQVLGAAGLVLLLVGALAWGLYLFAASNEHHSFTSGGRPPKYAQVVTGHTYRIGIHGGVPAERRAGITPDRLRCSITLPGFPASRIAISPESTDTKATEQIASFVAPYTGKVSVTCDRLGAVFVDNTESDPAGVLLVLATILLTIGAPVLLAGLRLLRTELRRAGGRSDVGGVHPAAERPL
jgi:hypothetical protein